MTHSDADMELDADGIPILTERIPDEAAPSISIELETLRDDESYTDKLTGLLLDSPVFSQQLDEIATELVHSVRRELEQTLRPALEEVIARALDDSSKASRDAVRKRLESTLPDLLERLLED